MTVKRIETSEKTLEYLREYCDYGDDFKEKINSKVSKTIHEYTSQSNTLQYIKSPSKTYQR